MHDGAEPETEADQGPLSGLETRLLALEAQTQAQQSRLRDYEKALVERIADVDDDRRRAAAQLKRALDAQRAELEGHLRTRTRWLWAALILTGALAAAGSLLLYRTIEQWSTSAEGMALAEVAALRQEVLRLSAGIARAESVEAQVASLGGRAADLGAELKAVKAEVGRALAAASAAERIARSEERSRIAGEIERLEVVQQDLAARLEAAQRELAARVDVALQASQEPGEPVVSPPAAEPAGALPGEDATAPAELEAALPAAKRVEAEQATALGIPPVEPPLTTQARVYALQLIGFRDLARVREFAQEAGLSAPLWYLNEIRRRRPWYPVIGGLYPDYAAAQAARAELAPSLLALEPWIRPLPAGTELWPIRADAAAQAADPSPGVGLRGLDP